MDDNQILRGIYRPEKQVEEKIVGSAPEALDTLKEIADSLGNDANFIETIKAYVNSKVDDVVIPEATGGVSKVNGMTGDVTILSQHISDLSAKIRSRGDSSTASGAYSNAEGLMTRASGAYSHAQGSRTMAGGEGSHSQGHITIAKGDFSHAGGRYTEARFLQTVIGQYNAISNLSTNDYNATSELFIIGNGIGDDVRNNSLKVLGDGRTYAAGAYASTGADYAEYFEWLDGNIDNEDRVGYFVSLEGDKIRKSNSNDQYVVGVISCNPSVVGDNFESWKNQYLTDDWGRIQYHQVEIPEKTEIVEGETIITPKRVETQPIVNPDWDPNEEYISREKRKEWSPVGMMGKLLVRDDGTCVVDGFCTPNDQGIATVSDKGYRVMKRTSENQVLILIK